MLPPTGTVAVLGIIVIATGGGGAGVFETLLMVLNALSRPPVTLVPINELIWSTLFNIALFNAAKLKVESTESASPDRKSVV